YCTLSRQITLRIVMWFFSFLCIYRIMSEFHQIQYHLLTCCDICFSNVSVCAYCRTPLVAECTGSMPNYLPYHVAQKSRHCLFRPINVLLSPIPQTEKSISK